MSKSVVLGNGQIAIGLDAFGQVYDFHFPYVGLENHVGGEFVHRIGVWTEAGFSWICDGTWQIEVSCNHDNPHHDKIYAFNERIGVSLEFEDAVYNEKNIFIRNILVTNSWDHERDIRIFFNQQFEIYESYRGDTAYYDPESNVIVHYKGRRIFLINARIEETLVGFDDYSIGLHKIEGKEGTYIDAEDGKLQKNPIEHGLVDSVIRLKLQLGAYESKATDYWVCAGKLMDDVYNLNKFVIQKSPEYLVKTTKDYWKAWIGKKKIEFGDLGDHVKSLYYQSLRMVRIHSDNTGGIIASSDTDLLKYGRDTYSYVWPRDAALISIAMIKAGYPDIAKRFFDFCRDTITPSGYFMHKYRVDRSIGSSWHPWIQDGKKVLPIQIDETALVIIAIYKFYEETKDIEYIEKIYNKLIIIAIDFLISTIDERTGLIHPSYDLWEENYGISTFTMSTVCAALESGAKLAKIFGKEDKAEEYKRNAEKVREAIVMSLYDHEKNMFYKHLRVNREGDYVPINVVDVSSLYGVFKFEVLESTNTKVEMMKQLIHSKLECNRTDGGFARYEQDFYYRSSKDIPGNPWIITTLWICQLEIKNAKNLDDLKQAKRYINWTVENAGPGGILPEQINPFTREGLSAGPLVWSHSEFILTVLEYIEKYEKLTSKS